jgi:hypothetical protein
LNQLLQTWEIYHLEKHVQLIQTCIKKGLADADQEARVFSRKLVKNLIITMLINLLQMLTSKILIELFGVLVPIIPKQLITFWYHLM